MIKTDDSNEVSLRIVAAARELFMKRGQKKTTIREIAKASDTNVAMVNYYFRSKDRLFEAIFEESFGLLVSRIFTAVDSDLPFFDMLEQWVDSYFKTLSDNPLLPAFILTELNQNPDLLKEKIRLKNPSRLYTRLYARIEQEEKKGTIKKLPAPNFLLSVASLCIFPFIGRPLIGTFLNMQPAEYDNLLKSHKEFVMKSIIDILKPE